MDENIDRSVVIGGIKDKLLFQIETVFTKHVAGSAVELGLSSQQNKINNYVHRGVKFFAHLETCLIFTYIENL